MLRYILAVCSCIAPTVVAGGCDVQAMARSLVKGEITVCDADLQQWSLGKVIFNNF